MCYKALREMKGLRGGRKARSDGTQSSKLYGFCVLRLPTAAAAVHIAKGGGVTRRTCPPDVVNGVIRYY